LDIHENITQQLRRLLKSFNLNDCAQAISLSVGRMPADEYHSPPAEGVCLTGTGVAGQPLWWDLLGHFNLQSLALAQSLVRKLGSVRINTEFGLIVDDVVKEIMQILCPLVKYYGGGCSYDKHRQQLITTLDLDEEVHQITRGFIHHRSYQSASVGAGDHEAKFIAERITSLANYHLVNSRSLSPVVLRQCGWTRRRLGEEISSRVHSLVLSGKLLSVEIRPIETLVCDADLVCMVNVILSLRHELPDHAMKFARIDGYPASPLYLEFARRSSNRWGERIRDIAREFLSYRPTLLSFLEYTAAPFLLQLEEELALRVQMLAAEYSERRPLRFSMTLVHTAMTPFSNTPGEQPGLALQQARAVFIGMQLLRSVAEKKHNHFHTCDCTALRKVRVIWMTAQQITDTLLSSVQNQVELSQLDWTPPQLMLAIARELTLLEQMLAKECRSCKDGDGALTSLPAGCSGVLVSFFDDLIFFFDNWHTAACGSQKFIVRIETCHGHRLGAGRRVRTFSFWSKSYFWHFDSVYRTNSTGKP
jgi:hypothetical protein